MIEWHKSACEGMKFDPPEFDDAVLLASVLNVEKDSESSGLKK